MRKRLTKAALVVAVAGLIGSTAAAQYISTNVQDRTATSVSATALDATSTWTGWKKITGYSKIVVEWQVVADGDDSVTAVTMRCETSHSAGTTPDAGVNYCSRSTGAGTSTLTCPHSWTSDPSGNTTLADKTGRFIVEDPAADYLNCVFTDTGGGASDTLSAWFRGVSP